MPTILRIGPYRFFFYSDEGFEPAHIHVQRDHNIAKFWLMPIQLQDMGGFRSSEITRIQRLIEENHKTLVDAWYDYFTA